MFRYADYIYQIYKEKSFTQAAKKLFISQPALSATVKKAEHHLGFKIFNRGAAPVILTDVGRVYISAIEEMYRIERNFKNYIENMYSLSVGTITVSGTNFISSFILPKIIMEFSKRHPQIDIAFTESNSLNLQEKLLSEEIEILIDYDFDSDLYTAFPLTKEHILLAVPKHFDVNRLFAGRALTAKDIHGGRHLTEEIPYVDLSVLKDEKFILLKTGNHMQKTSYKICRDYGFVPQPVICLDQLMTSYNIASSGMGITFTTDTVIHAASDSGNLLFYKLNSPHAERTLYIAHKKKKYASPAVMEFIKVAEEIYKLESGYLG